MALSETVAACNTICQNVFLHYHWVVKVRDYTNSTHSGFKVSGAFMELREQSYHHIHKILKSSLGTKESLKRTVQIAHFITNCECKLHVEL